MTAFLPLVCRGDVIKIKEFFDEPESGMPVDIKSFLNARDESGKSALDFAAMLGRSDVVRLLIEYGADPNFTTTRGYTALHRAASWGHVECVQALVEKGTDMQVRNIHGERAREAAMRYGKMDCVELLDHAEAVANLQAAIQKIKGIISDPEKNLGRLNREDKGTANKLCLEKTDWLNSNKENASVEQLYRAKKELEEGVQHIMLKLEDLDIDK